MSNSDWGVFPAFDTVRFERILPGPIERVWSYLTDSELRGQWLAPGPLSGEVLELSFNHADLSPHQEDPPAELAAHGTSHVLRCQVLEIEPPHRLTFKWGEDDSVVTFELSHAPTDMVRLVVNQSRLKRQDMTQVAGGWHTHLAILSDRLNGLTPKAFWAIWKTLDGKYERRLPAA